MSTLDDDIIGTGEAAKICHVTPQTMRNWDRSEYGPRPFMVNNRRKYRRSQCVAFYKAISTPATYRREPLTTNPHIDLIRY